MSPPGTPSFVRAKPARSATYFEVVVRRCSHREPKMANATWPRSVPAPSLGRRPCSPTTITTLKDPRRDAYHRLSPAGWFVWQHLDGEHTLQDLTSEYLAKYEVLSSHAVLEAVVGLVDAGFAEGAKPSPEVIAEDIDRATPWQRARAAIRRILD